MAKRFSLLEAQHLIPEVERLLRGAIEAKQHYQEAEQAIQEFGEHITLSGGALADRAGFRELRARRDDSAAQIRDRIEELQATGGVLKDLDTGLVDFRTLYRGDEVYLCWKLGESLIEFWHGVDEGFRGRKPIDQDFMDHHSGDRPH